MNISAGSLGGRFPKPDPTRLQVLSIVHNDKCNFSCRHCYLAPSPPEHHLARQEWTRFLSSVFDHLVPDVVTFAGKEVFIDSDSANVLFEAIRLRNRLQDGRKRQTRVGVITNGTLIHRYRHELEQTCPDYLDISLDGPPEINNRIRGARAFEQTKANLDWLLEMLGDRLWITHTIMSSNAIHLPQFVQYCASELNIMNISVGFYLALPYTDRDLGLPSTDTAERIGRMMDGLRSVELPAPVRVVMELEECLPETRALKEAGWICDSSPLSTHIHRFDNGLTLTINASTVPTGLWRAVRVTPEGFWLAAEDLIDAKQYPHRAIARLEDYDFDSVRLYEAGLKHPRFAEITGMDSSEFLDRLAMAS